MRKLAELFAIDLRSLSAFRVCISLLVLFDLATRSRFLVVHYTDQGLIPRAHVVRSVSGSLLPIHYLAGTPGWEILLFAITIAFAVMLLVGCRTRLASVALWLLMTSLRQRNIVVTDGGDAVVCLLLFWSMFLPLGARWSVDSGRGRDGLALSPASGALLLQPALLYLFAGLAKDSPAWLDGSAIAQALGQSLWVRPLGEWLREQQSLSVLLTQGTPVFEILGPLLLFSPIATVSVRVIGIVVFLIFQLGLALCLDLWLFPFYSSVAFVAFLPGGFWGRVARFRALGATVRASEVPLPTRRGPWSRLVDGLVVAALVLGLLAGIGFQLKQPLLPDRLRDLASKLGIEQHWEMYRYVTDTDYRIRTRGVLRDGSEIDFATHRDGASWKELRALMNDYRGKAYIERLWSPGRQADFASWLCRQWNASERPGHLLARVELDAEKTPLLPSGRRGLPVYQPVYQQRCPP